MNIRITKAFQCMLNDGLSVKSYAWFHLHHLLHDQGLRLCVVL